MNLQTFAAVPADTVDGRAIDLGHLARMTLGDPALEREVLQLFFNQAGVLLARMERAAAAPVVSALAHTLKGSAQGIGAWRVAAAAAAVEEAAPDCQAQTMAALSEAVTEARSVIRGLLQD